MITLPNTPLVCDDDSRKVAISKDPQLLGIDYIEVEDPNVQTTLDVYFIKKVDPNNAHSQHTALDTIAAAFKPDAPNVSVTGGVRVKGIRVKIVTHTAPDSDVLRVTVNSYGDFSTYTLAVENAAYMDPIYNRCDFSFKAGCKSRFDCRPSTTCPPAPEVEPLIDYMAKDFASFRQALVDLIPTLVPSWKERHDADLGMAMVDLLAYSADQLSYYQDAVANEAYLASARHRISLRRHARLIDYQMHDGASARVFVFFQMGTGIDRDMPKGTQVLTHIDVPLRNTYLPKPVIQVDYKDDALRTAAAVFETTSKLRVCADRNGLATHSWQEGNCQLKCGATSIDVEYPGNGSTLPEKADFVLLEELPQPGKSPHRQVVRLTDVTIRSDHDFLDPGAQLATLTWGLADALNVPFSVGKTASVVRGNIALCDHGMTVVEWYPGDPASGGPGIDVKATQGYRFLLRQGPLSQQIADDPTVKPPVATLTAAGPENAIAQVRCETVTPSATVKWDWTRDLLDSNSFATRFTAETDNDGRTSIRFGANDFGMSPTNGSHVKAAYRIGVGAAAGIGADAIGHVIDDPPDHPNQDVETVRNPMPAWGGVDPEDMDRVKLVAPAAFRATQMRAVTEADYADIATRHPEVSHAVARFTWTGSWRTVVITVQPKDSPDPTPDLKDKIRKFVEGYAIAGYDLEIRPPRYVPLELDLFLCVKQDHFRADVEKAVISALSSGVTETGDTGFFHHDRWPMGQSLFLSKLYEQVQSVDGVESVTIKVLKRVDQPPLTDPTSSYLDQGIFKVGALEAIRLDNNPSLPENGSLDISSGGGK